MEEAHGMTASRNGVVCSNILALQQWVVTQRHFWSTFHVLMGEGVV